jgi:ribosomal protein S12 methylthiotransferase
MEPEKIIHLISLGCAKNLVDSERLVQQLKLGGWEVSIGDTPARARVAILNTCGFIADAKEESVDTLLELTEAKKRGEIEKIIVFGCLSQRYASDLPAEVPEVDRFFGVDAHEQILQYLNTPFCSNTLHQRHLSTPSHYAYLKVSEGCNRKCAFCIIPSIRGGHRSTPIPDLVREAEYLSSLGVKELLLVAQDLSSYGTDLKVSLRDLLSQLEKVEGIQWIRLHYAYPAGFPTDILPLMAQSEKILPYLDIPFQHASNSILKAMRRGHTSKQDRLLIHRLREEVPGIILRTTLITGYPGETEEDFNQLLLFVKEIRFDRLGVFTFSPEEGTHAATLPNDVPDDVKEARAATIMELQESISLEKNQKLIGSSMEVLIDRLDGEDATGRTQGDSPEVDQEVFITPSEGLSAGTFVNVIIESAGPHDLFGRPTSKGE